MPRIDNDTPKAIAAYQKLVKAESLRHRGSVRPGKTVRAEQRLRRREATAGDGVGERPEKRSSTAGQRPRRNQDGDPHERHWIT